MNATDILLKSPFFQGLDEKSIRHLAEHVHEKTLLKGKLLFGMGDRAENLFIIARGWIKLYRTSREGGEVIIHIFGPGETFAEAAVFNEKQTYPVSAEAVEDAILLEVPRSYFLEKIGEDSLFALKILGAIASRQHYLVQQLEQVTSRTAPQRIGAFLLRFCHHQQGSETGALIVELPYDKSLISTRLNIQPETFSRALAKLKPYGVETQGKKIIIHTPQKLADFCDLYSGEQSVCAAAP